VQALGYASHEELEAGLDHPLGVTVLDEARLARGLVHTTDERSRCLALDAQGAVARDWNIPGRTQVETFLALADGGAIALSVDEGLTRVTPDSRTLWTVDAPTHHELAPAQAGGWLVPVWTVHDHQGRDVRFDEIHHVSESGEQRMLFSTWDAREQLRANHAPTLLDQPAEQGARDQVFDYYHLNSIQELPDGPLAARDERFAAGNLLLCFRNVSLLVVLDSEDLTVSWSFGPGVLDFPHTPRITDTGTLLVFDNGFHRGWSRVLELDPLTGETVWTYEGEPRESFFSRTRGSAQRLENGNTLICESEKGRVIEVTPDRQVVWEYWNPIEDGSRRRRLYRADKRLLED